MPSTNFRRRSESASGDLMSIFGHASRCSMRRLCSNTASVSPSSCFLTSKRRMARSGSSTNPKRRESASQIKAKSVSFSALKPGELRRQHRPWLPEGGSTFSLGIPFITDTNAFEVLFVGLVRGRACVWTDGFGLLNHHSGRRWGSNRTYRTWSLS